jgi:hypothetical protein
MILNRLSLACIAATFGLMAPSTYGNDIIDFLRAVNQPRYVHHHYGVGYGPSSFRYGRPYRFRRTPLRPHRSVSLHFGDSPIHAYQPALPPTAVPSTLGALPHELGQIVTCTVPLAPHVRVRNSHEIAPGACPVVVAVRDPHLGAWGSSGCVEGLAYVQVLAPPVPLRRATVSPCRTVVELDYGDWEITVTSANGLIEVEYDD